MLAKISPKKLHRLPKYFSPLSFYFSLYCFCFIYIVVLCFIFIFCVHKPPKNREGDHNRPGERGGSAIFSPQKAESLLEDRIFSGLA